MPQGKEQHINKGSKPDIWEPLLAETPDNNTDQNQNRVELFKNELHQEAIAFEATLEKLKILAVSQSSVEQRPAPGEEKQPSLEDAQTALEIAVKRFQTATLEASDIYNKYQTIQAIVLGPPIHSVKNIDELNQALSQVPELLLAYEQKMQEVKVVSSQLSSVLSELRSHTNHTIDKLQEEKEHVSEEIAKQKARWFPKRKTVQAKITSLQSEQKALQERITELEEQYEQARQKHEIVSLPQPYELRVSNTRELIARSLEKIHHRFQDLLAKTALENLGSEFKIPPQVITDLNTQYIEEYVLSTIPQEIGARIRKKAKWEEDSEPPDIIALQSTAISNLSNSEMIQKGLTVLRESFAIKMSQDQPGYNDVMAKIDELPLGVKYQISTLVSWNRCANEKYHTMAKYCGGFENFEHRDAVEQTYLEVIKKVRQFCKDHKLYSDLKNIDRAFELDRIQLTEKGVKKEFEEYIQDFDAERWDVFQQNSKILKIIGKQRVEQTKEFLANKLLEDIIDHNDLKSWLNLRPLRTAKAVPLMLLSAYNKFYSLVSSEKGGAENSELYKLFLSLKPKEIEQISQLGIPGLNNAVELIRNNIDDLINPESRRSEKGFKIQAEMHKALTDIIIYLLEKEDKKVQIFALNNISSLTRLLPGKTLKDIYKIVADKIQTKTSVEFQNVAVNNLIDRATDWHDIQAAITILENNKYLTNEASTSLRKKTPTLLFKLALANIKDRQLFRVTGDYLDKTSQEIEELFDLLAELRKAGHNIDSATPKNLDAWFDLSQNPELRSLIQELHGYGYNFDIEHIDKLPSVLADKTAIIQQIEEVRRIFPEFAYSLLPGGNDWETSPYVILARSYLPNQILDICRNVKNDEQETVRQKIFKALLCNIRIDDPKLQNNLSIDERKNPSEQLVENFSSGMRLILEKTEEGKELAEYKFFFTSPNALRYIAREPGKIQELLNLRKTVPDLFDLLINGGPLYSNANNVIRDIFENGDAVSRARQITQIFTQRGPYWERLFFYTQTRLGEELRVAISDYPVSNVGRASIHSLIEEHRQQKATGNPEPSQLECIVANKQILEDINTGREVKVIFSHLHGIYKELLFKDILKRSIETSHSLKQKRSADFRNRNFAGTPMRLEAGNYIHASAIDYLPSILEHGNLPGEALGEASNTDDYPFHVDFSVITTDLLANNQTIAEIINHTRSGAENYGSGGALGSAGKIYFIYDRNNTNWENGNESFGSGQEHGLLLGAMPATEISAIMLESPEDTLEKNKQAIVENGFYIPLYNKEGKLLFSPQDFDLLFSEAKPYSTIEDLLTDQSYLKDLDKPQASSLHSFTLKEHLLRVTNRVEDTTKEYRLNARDQELVKLAARLHDIGKGTAELNLQQWYDNPSAAAIYLKKIRNLDYEEAKDVLYLIQHDELLGDILQGKQPPDTFKKLFTSDREQKMLLALYKADVWEIDGSGDLYRQWQVDEKISNLGLNPD